MSSLEYLNVSSNKLTTLPSEIGNLSHIKNLYANSNRITSLPNTLNGMSSLT